MATISSGEGLELRLWYGNCVWPAIASEPAPSVFSFLLCAGIYSSVCQTRSSDHSYLHLLGAAQNSLATQVMIKVCHDLCDNDHCCAHTICIIMEVSLNIYMHMIV